MQLFMVEWYRTDHHNKYVSFYSIFSSQDKAQQFVNKMNDELQTNPNETFRLRVVTVDVQE